MLSLSFLLHANLLYAEYPFERIPEIVEKSYLPVLEALLSVKSMKAVFNFTGFTLELIAGEHPDIYKGKPELLGIIREGIKKKRIEITGTSWVHAVLPTLPLPLVELDIGLFQAAAERILGIRPSGFFPPELAVSPLLPGFLNAAGYRWCVVDRELLSYSSGGYLNDANDFIVRPRSFTKLSAIAQYGSVFQKLSTLRLMRKTVRHVTDYTPVMWQGAGDAAITAFPLESSWIALSLFSLSHRFLFREKGLARRLLRRKGRMKGFLFPYSSDIEFFGLGGNTQAAPIPIARALNFFRILEQEGISFTLPGEYLASHQFPAHRHYCKAGSWSTDKDFRLWTDDADNRALDRVCFEAWEAFREKADSLAPEKREALLKDLLLSFNSDGRGWTPLPEHRLFCYNRAKKVLDAKI